MRASSALHRISDRSRAAGRVVLRSRRPQRLRIRHRGILFRAAARHRPHRRAARGRGHHRRRVGGRHRRHHAGAGAQPRSAHGEDARPVARQCRRHGAAVARHQGRRLEQMVPQAVPVGRGQDRNVGRDQGPRGPPEAVAVRALALVPAAARRAHHGRPDVRRGHLDGRARASGAVAAAVRPHARSVRDADRFLRLPPAGADPRSAADPRARPQSRAAIHLSAAVRRNGRKRLRHRQRARARLCRARDLVVSGRVSAGADRRDGRGGCVAGRRPGRGARNSSHNRSSIICAPTSIRR